MSDPHAADMGIRFPFLVVEAKGLSLDGSLVSAQNQAAISGASMLAILKDLKYHGIQYNTAVEPESTHLKSEEKKPPCNVSRKNLMNI